jgi:hypothetical protein
VPLLSLVLLLTPSIRPVEYDHAADFSRYTTWSWQTGFVVPPDVVPDKRIREAVARGLAARESGRSDPARGRTRCIEL